MSVGEGKNAMAGDAAGVRRVGFSGLRAIQAIERWCTMVLPFGTTPVPYTPDGQAAVQILGKIEAMLTQLDGTSTHTVRLGQIRGILTGMKAAKPDKTTADLPMKDGAVDRAGWDAKPEVERRAIWEALSAIHDELRFLNAAPLVSGKRYFVLFFILLLLVVLAYVCSHREAARAQIQPVPSSQQIVEALGQARFVELKLVSLKEKQNRKLSGNAATAAPPLGSQGQPPKSDAKGVQPIAPLPPQPSSPEQDLADDWRASESKWEIFKQGLYKIPLSYETMRLLGMVSAELQARDTTLFVTYQNFLKHLQTDLESLSTTYFWNTHPWRWLELSLWATMGCLVGLLFYIAGLLGMGVFRPEEGTMFMAELLMAPIVVPVIFFLFTLSGIAEFIPSQSSTTMNIGVAFIFGFAIRRTIGILDIIKKRLFPDPTP